MDKDLKLYDLALGHYPIDLAAPISNSTALTVANAVVGHEWWPPQSYNKSLRGLSGDEFTQAARELSQRSTTYVPQQLQILSFETPKPASFNPIVPICEIRVNAVGKPQVFTLRYADNPFMPNQPRFVKPLSQLFKPWSSSLECSWGVVTACPTGSDKVLVQVGRVPKNPAQVMVQTVQAMGALFAAMSKGVPVTPQTYDIFEMDRECFRALYAEAKPKRRAAAKKTVSAAPRR